MKFLVFVFLFIVFFAPSRVDAATILDVPFSPQAPQNQWRAQPFADACEETTITMLEAFYNKTKLTPSVVRSRILEFVAYEQKNFGFHRDTNSTFTARLLNERTGVVGTIVENPTAEAIKAEIDAGHPVIFLAYSPLLKNPHYGGIGNPYHVLLITGYDENSDQFITNDPGTRFGREYRYPIARLMDANHDFKKPNRANGGRFMIFTRAK